MKEYLFVYGSLRSGGRVPAEIAPLVDRFRRLGAAQVNGRLYDLGPYCGAVLDDSAHSLIHGELIELPLGEEMLETLDRYEEIDPSNMADSLFARKRTTIALADNSQKEAWIYVYNRPPGKAPLISGGDYQRYKESLK